MKLKLGHCYMTPGATSALQDSGQTAIEFLERHSNGDWGEVCEEVKRENELSIECGFRVLSAYRLKSGKKIWVITEADKTTILLPEEY
jgi:hypothetical protein